MSSISKPNTFSANTTMSSSEVNDNFDTIYNDYNGSISSVNLASNAVTTAKIADSNVTTAKIADASVTNAKIGNGLVAQVVDAYLNTSGTTSSTIPLDDTIPQNTEGTEVLTVAITPTSSTNVLKVRARIMVTAGSGATSQQIALFRDTTAGAIAAGFIGITASSGAGHLIVEASVVAGSTSETTFKVRIGSAGGASRWNGSGGRYFGDIPKSYIEVTEVKAA